MPQQFVILISVISGYNATMNNIKNCLIYARVSSIEQKERGLSIPSQLKSIRDYASANGYRIVKEYIDAKSAKEEDRPIFKEMIAHARSDETIKAILVHSLDRFARNQLLSLTYRALLEKQGIYVYSVTQPIAPDSAYGKFTGNILGAVAEFYSLNLAQESLKGLTENTRQGYWNGGRAPFGYSVEYINHFRDQKGRDVRKGRLKINLKESKTIKEIFAMCLKGYSLKGIAKKLNAKGLLTRKGGKWTSGTIRSILTNEIYTGRLTYNRRTKKGKPKPAESWIIKENAHKSIISKELFDHVQGIFKKRAPKYTPPRITEGKYLLTGLLKCGKCGSSYVINMDRFKNYYYKCSSSNRGNACGNIVLPMKRFEKALFDKIKTRILTKDNINYLVKIANESLKEETKLLKPKENDLTEELEDVKARIGRLRFSIEEGGAKLNEIVSRINELSDRKSVIERDLEKLNHEVTMPSKITRSVIERFTDDLTELLLHADPIIRRNFIKSLIERIDVFPDKTAINYTFKNIDPSAILMVAPRGFEPRLQA